MLTPLDHLLVAALVLALPLEGYFEVRVLLESLKRGDPAARSRALIRTIVLQWTLVAALFAGWSSGLRPWTALGLRTSDLTGSLIGAGASIAALVLVVLQYRRVRSLTPERRQRLIERIGESIRLLPATLPERRIFAFTAVTAGICEEILCRGFMFWYLQHWMGPWSAVLVASVPFAGAHLYQGPKGAVRTGFVALFVGALYVLSGSLIWPMIVHATIDLGAGALGRFLSTPGDEHECAASPAPV